MRTIIRDNYTPKPGDYHDMYVFDEARGKSWRFDCDGVFYETTIENELGDSTTTAASQALATHIADGIDEKIAEETAAREAADDVLQEEIDAIKNSPDVVDIVATYADLQAYDTSSLGTDDIVRVLRDEMHDGASTYYRWNDPNAGWNFIGTVGDYYTISQVDTLLAGKQDALTAGDNINIDADNVISATDTTYTAGEGLDLSDTTFSVDTTTIQEKLTAGTNVSISGNTISATDTTYSDFVGTDGTTAGTAGLVPAPATTDAGKVLGADGTWVTGGPNVVQTTGTSTTDVMSQNAVTSMVFADPSTKNKVQIGNNANNSAQVNGTAIGADTRITNGNNGGTAIGANAVATGAGAISIAGGWNSTTVGADGGISIGVNTTTYGRGAISLGAFTPTNRTQGKIEVGTEAINYGYNNSNYRLLTGLYDPQNAHDAATKGYVDNLTISYAAINGSSAPTTATEGKYVGQLYYDTTNDDMYYLKEIDTTDPDNVVYTWDTLGGGSSTLYKELTTADYNYPTNNPTSIAAWLLEPGFYTWGQGVSIRFSISTGAFNPGSMQVISDNNGSHAVIYTQPQAGWYGGVYTLSSGQEYDVKTPTTFLRWRDVYAMSGSAINGVQIGDGAQVTVLNQDGIAIGKSARNAAINGVTLGRQAFTQGVNSIGAIAIGHGAGVGQNANAAITDAIALGRGAKATRQGEINVEDTIYTTAGFNNTQYRLLSGLYDGQSNHDAATVAQGNTLSTTAPTTTTEGVLGQLYTDTTNMHTYQCTNIDTTDPNNPVYTWTQRW